MLQIRGKINGRDKVSEVVLHKGQLEGDADLVLFIKRLSAKYEAYGVVPVLNVTPEEDEFWKDESILVYLINQICTNVQTSKNVKPPIPEAEEGIDY